MPGLGFLRDVMTTPFLVHWTIADGLATSPQLPRRAHPRRSVHGRLGRGAVACTGRRTGRARSRAGGAAVSRCPRTPGAPCRRRPAAARGLRTLPPRENGGNFDVKQLSKGAKLLLPVAVEGALFSTGDAHFAQGDGEVCVTAVEMGATCAVRFRVHRGEAERHNIRWPRFSRSDYFIDPRWAAPRKFIATMGMPVDDDGVNHGEDLTSACRNARAQHDRAAPGARPVARAGVLLCSVAVDLRISNVVDVPNYVVSALLPEDVFQG